MRWATHVACHGEAQFEGHGNLTPREWPTGAEAHLDGSVYRPVVLTARTVMPDDGRWARVWDAMRELAVRYGAQSVRLVCWFGWADAVSDAAGLGHEWMFLP
ncbi:hypothetical protein [Streptomyces sp. NPDC048442]|uniref:hypothetical protein n=1 Tax=Streptomyces sp. NPDC048442 TaxID=3154823 RepID=UPI003420A734